METVYRHGIVVTDGNREGKRTPKIAEENVARFIDVLRWWASVNDQAQVVRRVPWKEIYEFICVRKAWKAPAPLNSEQLKERVRTVVLFQIAYTTSVVVRMVGIDGRALARDYSLRPVLG